MEGLILVLLLQLVGLIRVLQHQQLVGLVLVLQQQQQVQVYQMLLLHQLVLLLVQLQLLLHQLRLLFYLHHLQRHLQLLLQSHLLLHLWLHLWLLFYQQQDKLVFIQNLQNHQPLFELESLAPVPFLFQELNNLDRFKLYVRELLSLFISFQIFNHNLYDYLYFRHPF